MFVPCDRGSLRNFVILAAPGGLGQPAAGGQAPAGHHPGRQTCRRAGQLLAFG
ncbi:hypothetical protein [Kamptonema formosum]|uniref:hypothetical protein n=1 Tax=Kamptonema formosum TaxID=331992 RepID=UPI00034DB160|nr:hypothetical protein [Oscillatoria sp. PCC 10802]